MDGVVVSWFQMMQKAKLITSWSTIHKAIESQYGPSQFENPRAQLFKLTQSTSVAEIYREFMILANRVEGLSDDAVLDCFVSGLKPSVRWDVVAHLSSTL